MFKCPREANFCLFSSEWEGDHVSDVTNYHWAPQSSFWIFTSNCYFGGTIGLNSLKRQRCQTCGVIKRSEITNRWAEKEAQFPSQGNSAFEFCRKPRAQMASSCTPKSARAKLQLSFGGSMDQDMHGSMWCSKLNASSSPWSSRRVTLLPQVEQCSSTFCKHTVMQT